MRVRKVALRDFRNFTDLQTFLGDGVNIVYGGNAQGKTNFLESIYFCAMGRSQRAGNDRELVRFGQHEAHIQALIEENAHGPARTIDVHIKKSENKKGIAVDHIPIRKMNELFGTLLVVMFSPEDLRLVKSGPAERRTFMDMELCQLSAVYYHALRQYHHALKQRNNLLKSIPRDASLTETVFIWDEQLCMYARQIMQHRSEFIDWINRLAGAVHGQMTGGTETLDISYHPGVGDIDSYAERLRRGLQRDIQLGSTSVGPHKDDLLFSVNGNDARVFGSQGQQRTAALAAKLAEVEIIRQRRGTSPVLLLDDVLSELDGKRQAFLIDYIGREGLQTVITCTGVEDIVRRQLGARGKVLKMVNGALTL